MASLSIMRGRLFILTALAVAALAAPSLRAAEQITFRSGSTMSCDHHEIVQDHTRLYLGPENYIEIPSQEVTAIETIPDPPAVPEVSKPELSPAHTATPPVPATKFNSADLQKILAKASQENNLDIDLLASVVKAESNGNPRALSRAGARGLMQLMPGTASDLGVEDSFKPEENVHGGSTYFNSLLIYYHEDIIKAIAAYNAGPEAVDKYHGVPPYRETQLYVARVIHEFNRRVSAREARQKAATAQARAVQN